MTQLTIAALSFSYSQQQPALFNNLDFKLEPGSFNLLVGPSGSGKSTLFKLMAGLYPQYGGYKTNGAVLLNGQDVSTVVPFARARKIALLFQNPSRQFAMRTVEEQLVFVLENLQFSQQQITTRINAVLEELDLTPFKKRELLTLSGGEQQRVALAAVLAMDSEIILLDEPFANVDAHGRATLLQELLKLQQNQHKTIMLSDHELTGYAGIAEHVYQLKTPTSRLEKLPLSILQTLPTEKKVTTDPQIFNQGQLSWEKLSLATRERLLLKDSTCRLPQGRLGLLSGDNGVGKSTFFAALGQQKKYTGTIYYHGKNAARVRRRKWAKTVANIFQNSTDQFIKLHVNEELELSRKNTLWPQYWTVTRINAALTALQLAHLKDHVCYQLSGGQQKKLQVLSMLIMGQPVLLFDEPFAGLDAQSLHTLLTLIKDTVTTLGLSGLIISHQRLGVTEFMDYELHFANQTLQLAGDSDEK
ncbi:ATP-binding cassette domain-containing protein [Liquorilactobacillus satsumensis]|uniref:ATP-binding cassette domain-containing protein n=1 Tax=Liquorilactobacillus satsumensis TaxID=259059 RepID=UPI001E617046|nr:ABC transporter ATP-binding protein [Liquorilactobacillus satsumensis]MCC7666957.1 ABC transporter [Liquorilactobacillus satsumensis]MCP9357239.1 ABC transporter ATP-binding protein [Liquorilactobacillus satsumensis]MCP9371186.1 ABC transporter ATP-binding protein [Liquorilactobacillus satsumensis]